MHATWQAAVEAERDGRDQHYLGEDTPLSPERRKAFTGLKWFPIDPAFRFEGARLQKHGRARKANLGATGDDSLHMEEIGVFEFKVNGTACRLLAFSPAPGEVDEPYILVPFRDGTTGKETYGAGRYLDLEPSAEDVYDLDFNRAYHPYCAHDDAWSCTLPPPENKLAVRIEAGERL